MGDVAQILGINSSASALPKQSQAIAGSSQPSRAMKMTGMPREVLDLLGGKQDSKSSSLPPAVPAFPIHFKTDGGISKASAASEVGPTASSIKIGNKRISTQTVARKWVWAPFASSARTDGLMLRHWVRAEVEYPDYPYARFDIHLDPVTYTDEDYQLYLQHETWTRSETDDLMALVRKYELRWPVIYDRWFDIYYSEKDSPAAKRKIEDLQHRYYSVAAKLMQTRISKEAASETQSLLASVPDPSADQTVATENMLMDTVAARAFAASDPLHQPLVHSLGTGSSNKVFDLNYERERRAHMERLWNRTKEEELEETELRKELRVVEAQIRKLKKTGGHILAANGNASTSPSVISSTAMLQGPSPSAGETGSESPAPAALLDQYFASTAPTPMPENPYLQSGRLAPPATGGPMGLNKTLLSRMDTVLAELKVPPRPIPTKRVCDLYDAVRKDILTLLTLQKMVLQKEGQVQSKRLKLAKMGGNVQVADEETLLGISNPTTAALSGTTTSTSRGKGPRGGKGKNAAGAGKGKKTSSTTKPDEAGTKADTKETPGGKQPRKNPTKRKRKTESKSPTGAAAAATAAIGGHSPRGGSIPVTLQGAQSNEGKATGKKRSRKNAPT